VPDRPISFTDHLDPPDHLAELAAEQARVRRQNQVAQQRQREREWAAQRADADARKRAWIEGGNETRQPPEYRGRVFDVADRDGVHPTAFPPLRTSPQEGLSEEFIAFQAYNQTSYRTHPHYYCVRCTIRYNARDGGLCGPCIAETDPDEVGRRRRRRQPVEYPS
jgi:hypothetical protein